MSAIGGTVLAVGIAAAWSTYRFGSVARAVEYAGGTTLWVGDRTNSIGVVPPGGRMGVTFRLANLGDEPVQILGSQADCSCIARDDRPFMLGPRQDGSFKLDMELPREPGPIRRSLTLFTDAPGQQQIELAIVGEVGAAKAGDGH